MDETPKFALRYAVSKKGNETVFVFQIPSDAYPFLFERGFCANEKYRNIIKVRTVWHQERLKPYLDMTVKEAFEIAVEKQDWHMLPFSPIAGRALLRVDESEYEPGIIDWELYNKQRDDQDFTD